MTSTEALARGVMERLDLDTIIGAGRYDGMLGVVLRISWIVAPATYPCADYGAVKSLHSLL